jgi:hypothetical protein
MCCVQAYVWQGRDQSAAIPWVRLMAALLLSTVTDALMRAARAAAHLVLLSYRIPVKRKVRYRRAANLLAVIARAIDQQGKAAVQRSSTEQQYSTSSTVQQRWPASVHLANSRKRLLHTCDMRLLACTALQTFQQVRTSLSNDDTDCLDCAAAAAAALSRSARSGRRLILSHLAASAEQSARCCC